MFFIACWVLGTAGVVLAVIYDRRPRKSVPSHSLNRGL
jgi:hypothetical protein